VISGSDRRSVAPAAGGPHPAEGSPAVIDFGGNVRLAAER
jgi:hypothetical protein